MRELTRRQLLATGGGLVGAVAAGGVLEKAWVLLAREDLIPGRPSDRSLRPRAWTEDATSVTFAAIGDNGSGGRQAMAVADRMAATYELAPFGLVCLLGDICYYGSIEDRFVEVFLLPLRPLIDARVTFELTIGNHDDGVEFSAASRSEIEATLERLGTEGRYYSTVHGPAELFYVDSSEPALAGAEGRRQLAWLDGALGASTTPWRIVAMHHPVWSSGMHGSTARLQELVEPILVRHRVDLVLCGHDHHYERTYPLDGVTYVVSGGGCKTTPVEPGRFSAIAVRALEFVHVTIDGDLLVGRAISPDGDVIDEFRLRAKDRS